MTTFFLEQINNWQNEQIINACKIVGRRTEMPLQTNIVHNFWC